jgi:CheY-like chemotaxis protein
MSAESEAHSSGWPASPHSAAQEPGHSDDRLILVVDDDPMNRMVMSAILRKLGYRFHLATNGREAVDATRREAYAAVLMDCLMPVMDGYQATAAIRQDEQARPGPGARRRLPIIAVTAVAIKGAREQCLACGMDDFLNKPVVPESVAGVLERWLAAPDDDATGPTDQAAGPGEPEDESIDARALDALRELDPEGGDALITQVVGDFSNEVSPRFRTMQQAIARGDVTTLLKELHAVAGCASIVGATQVERLARSLETADPRAAVSDPGGAEALVTRLEEAFIRARDRLASITSRSDPEGAPRAAPG